MNYKYLTKQQEQKLINVLCGDYDLKATLKYIDDLMEDIYDTGYIDGYTQCRRDNEDK